MDIYLTYGLKKEVIQFVCIYNFEECSDFNKVVVVVVVVVVVGKISA